MRNVTAATPLLLSIVVLGAVAGVLLTFAGSRAGRLVLAPTVTAIAPVPTAPLAQPTATEAGPLPPTSGTLVYLRGHDLWLAALAGSPPPRAITSGAFGAGYAGYVRRSDGDIDLYYVTQLSDGRNEGNAYIADFALYRLDLDGGGPEELTRFVNKPLEPGLPTHAAVSPDGHYVLYSDKDGLVLINQQTGQTTRALTNPPCNEKCTAYMFPQWSSRFDRVKVTQVLYEGAREQIVDPLASPPTVIDTGHGGWLSDLSPDGTKLCESEFGYGNSGTVLVYDIASAGTKDAAGKLDVPTPTSPDLPRVNYLGCSWSSDGRLAFGYSTHGEFPRVGLAIVDGASFDVPAMSEQIDLLNDVAAWLPDRSGVLFNRGYDRSNQQLPPGVYRPGAGVFALPFEADWVLGVIP